MALTQQRLQSIDRLKNVDTVSAVSRGMKEFNSAQYGVDETKVIQEEPYANIKPTPLQKKAPGSSAFNRKASVELTSYNQQSQNDIESSPVRTIIEQTTEGNLGVNPSKKQELRKSIP